MKFKLTREYIIEAKNREDAEKQLRETQDEMDVAISFDEKLEKIS